MDIYPASTRIASRGADEHFTGSVWRERIIEAPAPARVCSGFAFFEPGSRTAWHTHPLGQTLCVLTGTGRVQSWGGDIQLIRAGDIVWIPPGEKHWHGAGPTTTMSYIATQEALEGVHVIWMEHVSNEQYGAGEAARTP
jgi:quercetin dioxygenase-like cupin family protein